MARPRSRPSNIDVKGAISGLRINQGITRAMLPEITFSPTIGVTARRIDKLGMNIKSFREPLERSIQQVIAPSFRKNFDVGGRPSWDPFSDATPEIQERIHHVGEHPLLIKSGLLRRTMGQLNIWTINPTSAVLMHVPVEYAAIQQAGYAGNGMKPSSRSSRATAAKAGRAGVRVDTNAVRRIPSIPARPFVMLQAEDIPAIERVFEKWLEERIARDWVH